jgi:predicted RNA-binding Zn ribbon-like protein
VGRWQGLNSSEARRFRTGRPCLDFAHTGGDGALSVFELLHDLDDVARWLTVVLGVDVDTGDGRSLADVIALRRAIWNGALHVVAGRPLRPTDRDVINAAAAQPPPVPRITSSGDATVAPASTTQALSFLARDAIDLFGGPLARRIRVCAAEDCGLLFVDQSRPGARRWCSMQRCGNLAKVRLYRSRVAAPSE